MAEVRYRAVNIWLIRLALGCVMVPISLSMLGAGAIMLTLDSLAGVLAALLCAGVGILIVAMLLIGTRPQFIVDDEGLTIVHFLSSRRIPWSQVAVFEQITSYWWLTGAVVVVLRDPPGQRVTALATTDRMSLYRGENPLRLGAPDAQLRPPTRAAIDAHRRWLAAARR